MIRKYWNTQKEYLFNNNNTIYYNDHESLSINIVQ